MSRWYKQDRPIVFFDLETTGADVKADRIVEIAVLRFEPDGARTEYASRVNPEISIPPETTEIHGIRDEDVKDSPRFEQIADRVLSLFENADCSGFNIRRFDLKVIAAEFDRAGRAFSLRGRRIIDPMVIYQQRNPRNLSAAYRHYCGKPLVNAHSALADCVASYEVLRGQFEKHHDLPLDPDALHNLCNSPRGDNVDPDGMLGRRFGAIVFRRGKYKGRTVESVATEQPDYLRWMISSGSFSTEVEDVVKKFINGN